MSEQPTHYVVIKSPYAQQILEGSKKFEYRPESSARAMGNKVLAIAVAKSPRTPEAGMIIGQVTFGKPATRTNGMAIPVKEYEIWPRDRWLASPGGLGVCPLPSVSQELDVSPEAREEVLPDGVAIQVTPDQKELFETLAESEGLPVGDYLLKVVRTVERMLRDWNMVDTSEASE